MADSPSHPKLSMRPKLTRIRIDELREHSDDIKAGWQKRKELAKDGVVNLLKAARGSVRKSEPQSVQEEKLGPRPVSRRLRASAKSSVPADAAPELDISDDVLDRLICEPSRLARRPTSNFLLNQKRRAGILSHERPTQAQIDVQPLDAEDAIQMFAGATYFDVEDHAGHQRPKVTYGWAPTAPEGHDAVDYARAEHKSFTARTIDQRYASTRWKPARRHVREVPSMLSADGKDPGTIGLTHFLEIPLRQVQHPDDAAIQRQHLLITNPQSLGLRDFDIENIADRLSELSHVYEMLCDGKGEAAEWDQHMIEEIGEDLFLTLLSEHPGSVSLRVQISALQRVLCAEQVWFDFAEEGWQTRLGQLMWRPREVVTFTDGLAINERDILMLQIALTAEVAVRLEIAHRLAASGSQFLSQSDLERMLDEQTEKLDWDLIVFQRWIKCFEAMSRPSRRLSFLGSAAEADTTTKPTEELDLVFQLRIEEEQWDGLRTFTRKLHWPEPDKPEAQSKDSFTTHPIDERHASPISEYDTPLTSPVASTPPPSRGTPALILIRSEKLLLAHAAFDEIQSLHNGETNNTLSWLAKSWLSGFFLPGMTVNQFLLHTLLETNPGTKYLLPESVNNNDGFVHRRQMYWSKDSVVGRVLAPTADAKECTGWIALPFVPQGQGDGWVSALVKDAIYASIQPRISKPGLISRTSDPLHSQEMSKLQAGDFTTLTDGHMIMGNEVQFEGVSISSSKVVQYTEDGFLVPKIVNLTFSSPRNSKMPPLTLRLTYAVHFVSSYPCYPYPQPRASGISPAHDSCAPIDSGRSSPMSSKELPPPPTHPLHINYTYAIIPAAALLSSALPEVKDSDSLILKDSSEDDNPSIYQIEDEEVVVLDCRGTSDLEVLARAWCAKVGENALIGRVGRTCLACCIREAIGLGIGVVIRI